MYKIVTKEELAPEIKLFKILAPEVARKVKPGHFIIIRINETGERIPLTVNDFDRERGLLTIVVQEVGKTTKLLGTLKLGDGILDLVGPCGNPSRIENFGRVICVGGGVGMAVIYPIARALAKVGNKVFGIMGAKTKELLIFEKEMKEICHKLYITTDDGSKGEKGFVTETLKKVLKVEHTIKEVTGFGHTQGDGKFVSFGGGIYDGQRINRVFAVGPAIMMKFVSEITKKLNFPIKTIVSLNSIMIDGTGMCGGCRVEVGEETQFTCAHGPEFDGHEVNWDLLFSRLNQYKQEEQLALERWKNG